MCFRSLLVAFVAICQSASAQDLLPDEAAKFLETASAKIKTNCDAIQSWQAKITAKRGKQHSASDFILAENGNWLLFVESNTASSLTSRAEPVAIRTDAAPTRLEYFFHNLTLDKAQLSATTNRIINQVPASKATAQVDIASPNPLSLFQIQQNRFDDAFAAVGQSGSGLSQSYMVTKPTGTEKIWTLTVTKTIKAIRPEALVQTWRLDESQSLLPISHSTTHSSFIHENTYEYDQVDGIYLPKKAIFRESPTQVTEFEVQTTSVNRGPKEVIPSYAEGDRLNDLSGNRLVFQSGAFKPAEGE